MKTISTSPTGSWPLSARSPRRTQTRSSSSSRNRSRTKAEVVRARRRDRRRAAADAADACWAPPSSAAWSTRRTPTSLRTDPAGRYPWHPDAATATFRHVRAPSGVSGVRLHDLRHYHGTMLADLGVPLTSLRDRLGHRDLQTTNIYAHGRRATDPRGRRPGWEAHRRRAPTTSELKSNADRVHVDPQANDRLDDAPGYHDAPSEAHMCKLAGHDEFVREGSRDPEHVRGFRYGVHEQLRGDRQRMCGCQHRGSSGWITFDLCIEGSHVPDATRLLRPPLMSLPHPNPEPAHRPSCTAPPTPYITSLERPRKSIHRLAGSAMRNRPTGPSAAKHAPRPSDRSRMASSKHSALSIPSTALVPPRVARVFELSCTDRHAVASSWAARQWLAYC